MLMLKEKNEPGVVKVYNIYHWQESLNEFEFRF